MRLVGRRSGISRGSVGHHPGQLGGKEHKGKDIVGFQYEGHIWPLIGSLLPIPTINGDFTRLTP